MAEDMNVTTRQTGGGPDAQNEAAAQRVAQESEQKADPAGTPGQSEAGADKMAGSEGANPGEAAAGSTTAGTDEPASAEASAEAAESSADDAKAGRAAVPAEGGAGKDASAAEADTAETRAARAVEKLGTALGQAALAAAGVPTERVTRALRLMDTQSIDPLAEDAAQKYADAATALIREIPELAPAKATVETGSTGEHARRKADTTDPFTRGFRSR